MGKKMFVIPQECFRPVSVRYHKYDSPLFSDLRADVVISDKQYKNRLLYFRDELSAAKFMFSEYPDIYDAYSLSYIRHSGSYFYPLGNGSYIRVPSKEVVKKYV